MSHQIKLKLERREIQQIANLIDSMKGQFGRSETGATQEITPNYTIMWDGTVMYWMGRVRSWCSPVIKKTQETRDSLLIKHGKKIKDSNQYELVDSEAFEKEVKELLDEKETIRFIKFKASDFAKKEKDTFKQLVPIEFWEIMTPYLEMDIKEFQEDEIDAVEEK